MYLVDTLRPLPEGKSLWAPLFIPVCPELVEGRGCNFSLPPEEEEVFTSMSDSSP